MNDVQNMIINIHFVYQKSQEIIQNRDKLSFIHLKNVIFTNKMGEGDDILYTFITVLNNLHILTIKYHANQTL